MIEQLTLVVFIEVNLQPHFTWTYTLDVGTTQFSSSRSPAQHVQLVTELVQTTYFQYTRS